MPRKTAAPKKRAARQSREAAKSAAPEAKETKHAGGRPTDYRPEYAAMAAKLCLAFGAIDRDLADFFGVAEQTINNWKTAQPEFLESIKAAKLQADSLVERRLFERACGFQHPELYIAQFQGNIITKEITKQYPPDTAAGIFWLKNRQPERWREKIDHELGTKAGDPIQALLTAIATGKNGGRFSPGA